MNSLATATAYNLPWDTATQADRLYRRVLMVMLGLLLVLAVTLPLLSVQMIDNTNEEQPPAFTRIVLEKKVLPEPEPLPKPRPKPEKRIVKAPPKPVPPTVRPEPEPQPVDTLAQAKDTAAAAGVLAFRDELASLRDSVDVEALNQTSTSRGTAAATEMQRAIVTRVAPANSGGINPAKLSQNTGGPALSARKTTTVQSTIAGTPRAGANPAEAQTTGGRSDEEIRRVMDSNKGAIFALYNRALRRDPLLEGKLVFEMVIHPDGRITELNLLSSELSDEQLTRRILGRINAIRFGSEDVLPTRVNYSFDFLPYT